MAHIFISYSREDEARIQPLAQALNNQGLSVFWDRRIPAGETWRSYIGKALIDASCVIVAWSRHSIDSNWVCEEADEGKQRGILVPILLDSVVPPIGFRSIQAADLTDWQLDHPSLRFDQLLQDIETVLHVASIPPPPIERPAERKHNVSTQLQKPAQRESKAISRAFIYALMAMLLVLAAGSGYWIYQKWKVRLENRVMPWNDLYPLKVRAQATGRNTANGPEYKFTILVNSTLDVLRNIKQVQYEFKNTTFKNQLVIAKNIEDQFTTSYIGWGCLTSVEVKVLLKDGTSHSFDFNMCRSLGPQWREIGP